MLDLFLINLSFYSCPSREGGNPALSSLDSRLRGNDAESKKK